ncbi:plant cysteine oxidase 2 [Daucus carota subsp. sativus]|nr:PREDICTED: plant cysteine oxidase 2-like [Daucus carota subsp. sativus]
MPMREKVPGQRKGKDYMESRKNRRRQRRLLPVQVLYNTCEQVFADCGPGIVPDPEKIRLLKTVLDGISGADVGVNPNMPFFREQKTEGLPTITYLHIHECDKFSIGIFCLPPSAVLPLHNHPEMTVFSKLLFGTMHIKSLDWVNGIPSNKVPDGDSSDANGALSAEARLAKVKVDADFIAPCDTSILYPTDGGNMHCFTAVTQCAVLDVLGPPYNDAEGRHCAYYIEHPLDRISANGISIAEEEREGYEWLQERDKPEGLTVYGVPYSGPPIAK